MAPQPPRQAFITGLRDAHAMERKSLKWLERQAARTGMYRKIQDRLMAHGLETRTQIRRLEQCLSELGKRPSLVKDWTTSMFGTVSDLADDMVPGAAVANSAFEHYEVATYKSLLVLANGLGLNDAAARLKASLEEEQRMADWVDEQVEEVTRMRYLDDERSADSPAATRAQDQSRPTYRAA